MATDYLLFIHGVNTRKDDTQPSYADQLFALIKQHMQPSSRTLVPLVVYWGQLSDQQENALLEAYKASSIWNKLWFQQFRATQIVRFAGDASLYLSRYVGGQVADIVAKELATVRDASPDDRLHLVTHSLGTVILFDLLFSARWDQPGINGFDSVMAIRDSIYGAKGNSTDPKQGIRLGSIFTMGSPLGIFSLMDVNLAAEDAKNAQGDVISTHDITPRLEQLLDNLHQELKGNKLPWRNFAHPGDPIACPLEVLIPNMVDGRKIYLDIHDVLIPASLQEIIAEPFQEALLDLVAEPFKQTALTLINGGSAHLSYLQSKRVAEEIAKVIAKTS
jgi:hypothetical protein